MNNNVAIERCPAYAPDTLYRALKKAVELAGGLDVAGKTVLLKPNILMDAAPEKAVCTHPLFLEAALRLVREMGAARILAGDSPGLHPPGFTARVSGLGDAVLRNGAEWVDFTAGKTGIPCPEGKVMKKFSVTKAVMEADVIISLPKLKNHQLLYFTGALKNNFGLIPSVLKASFHARFPSREAFASMIVDLNLALKQKSYTIMDAVTGMEGPGPSGGTPRHMGLVLASSNLLALDIAAAGITGYPPAELPVNKDALGRGYWLSRLEDIRYPGLRPEEVAIPDFVKVPFKKSRSQLIDFLLPKPLRRLRDSSAPAPVINHASCVRCGDCTRICASRAVNIEGTGNGRRAVIDYSRCIRCFCCHEICPVKAIGTGMVKPGRPRTVTGCPGTPVQEKT